eukprot:GHVH01007640.1.p1 GENE.GHVH01007640.1~~GHVH01007640.1.p1  ORF type:complete len:196 (+),score=28.05 GHVH01007640.1:804-1391(+)
MIVSEVDELPVSGIPSDDLLEARLCILSSSAGFSWSHLIQSPFLPPDEALGWQYGEEEEGDSGDSVEDAPISYDDPYEAIRHTDELCVTGEQPVDISVAARSLAYSRDGIIPTDDTEASTSTTSSPLPEGAVPDSKEWLEFCDRHLKIEGAYWVTRHHLDKAHPRVYRCPYSSCRRSLRSIRSVKSHLLQHYKSI